MRSGTGYRFTVSPETLDLMAFRRHVAAAKMSESQGQPEAALGHYPDALRLCRGSAGDSLADSAGATAIFAGIDGEFSDVAVNAADIAVRLRQPSRVLAPSRLAAEMDPLNGCTRAS